MNRKGIYSVFPNSIFLNKLSPVLVKVDTSELRKGLRFLSGHFIIATISDLLLFSSVPVV